MRRTVTLGVVGLLLGLLALGLDIAAHIETAERVPELAGQDIVRTVLVMASAAFLVAGVLVAPRDRRDHAAMGSRSSLVRATPVVLALLAGATALLVFAPMRFTTVGLEDGPVETATAVAFLVAAGVLGWATARSGGAWPRWHRVLAALGVVVLVAMAGEEISWGQRILGFSTPDGLREVNAQAEFNLHNIGTDASELFAYAGAVLVLVIIPWVEHRTAWLSRWALTATFVPSVEVVPVAATLAAMNYDQWSQVPTQLPFWVAVGVLLALTADRTVPATLRRAALASVVVICASQALTLLHGGASERLNDTKEYKELFLALGVLAATWSLARRWTSGAGDGVGDGDAADAELIHHRSSA